MGMFGKSRNALAASPNLFTRVGEETYRTLGGGLADALGGTADMVNAPINLFLRSAGQSYQIPTNALQSAVPQPTYGTNVLARYATSLAVPIPAKGRIAGKATKSIPMWEILDTPPTPTPDVMRRLGRIERVPMDRVKGTQGRRQWDRFARGEHPPAMVEGFSDKPVAIRRENGDYLVLDGHHRADLAYSKGANTMDMYVLDAKSYAPHIAGRPTAKAKSDDINALLRELGALD